MKIGYGKGKTEYGPGVLIELTGDEIATAIDAWLLGQNVVVMGPRTIRVNDDRELSKSGRVYVDPSGFVINDGKKLSGRGREAERLARDCDACGGMSGCQDCGELNSTEDNMNSKKSEKTVNIEKHFKLLGMRVEDKVTGLTGVVDSIAFDLYGCIQAILNPGLDKDLKQRECRWFDVSRLRVIEREPVMTVPDFEFGSIAEGKQGPADKPTM